MLFCRGLSYYINHVTSNINVDNFVQRKKYIQVVLTVTFYLQHTTTYAEEVYVTRIKYILN